MLAKLLVMTLGIFLSGQLFGQTEVTLTLNNTVTQGTDVVYTYDCPAMDQTCKNAFDVVATQTPAFVPADFQYSTFNADTVNKTVEVGIESSSMTEEELRKYLEVAVNYELNSQN